MAINDRIKGVSRRDFFKIAGNYGLSSTLLAASAFGGAMTTANLAAAAESTYEKRFAKEPKFTLKFGAAARFAVVIAPPKALAARSVELSP
ncbi:MAG: hypothetical protein AAFO93_15060, partial [Pseudomonadota bacterium]